MAYHQTVGNDSMYVMLSKVELGVFTLAVILSKVEESPRHNRMRSIDYARDDREVGVVIGRNEAIRRKLQQNRIALPCGYAMAKNAYMFKGNSAYVIKMCYLCRY